MRLDKKEYLKYVRMSQDLLLKLPKDEVTGANAAALIEAVKAEVSAYGGK